MSNRLQIFRERMAAFEGAANPQEAVTSGYYVTAPGKLLAEKISARIALRPASSHLLVGGIGSGKTTQLLVACENLKKIGDIYPIYVDVSLYTDISQITPGVLTAIAGVELSNLLKDKQETDIKNNIEKINKIAYGYSEKVKVEPTDIYLGLSHLWQERANSKYQTKFHKGIIPSTSNPQQDTELINAIKKLANLAKNIYGNIVLLFDGLDRLNDSKNFTEIINLDIKPLSGVSIGTVIVGSLSSRYSENSNFLEHYLDYFYYQPCFDVDNDTDAYDFFLQIINVRSQDNFIEAPATHLLVKYSGGVLRDFINLTQSAIEETYVSGDESLNKNHVIIAANSFAKAQILGLANDELEIIKQTVENDNFIPRTKEHINLLETRRILEYRYPKHRYAVHPTLIPVLEQIYV